MSKRLDRFLASKNLLMEVEKIQTWVDLGERSDHLPILLQIDKRDTKPAAPFKFNPEWLNEEECIILVKEKRVGYDPSSRDSASFQFAEFLKKVKNAVAAWASQKSKYSDKGLKEVEQKLTSLYSKIQKESLQKKKDTG